jgi:DNA-binding beta-propeller fold protein YncE
MRRLTTMYGVAAVFLGLNAAGGTTLYAESSNSGDLITINSVTGASTVVGHLQTAEQSPVGLAYNSATDTMYTRDFNNLYSVNRATAATTLIGTSAVQTSGLAFNPAHTLLYSVGTK